MFFHQTDTKLNKAKIKQDVTIIPIVSRVWASIQEKLYQKDMRIQVNINSDWLFDSMEDLVWYFNKNSCPHLHPFNMNWFEKRFLLLNSVDRRMGLYDEVTGRHSLLILIIIEAK